MYACMVAEKIMQERGIRIPSEMCVWKHACFTDGTHGSLVICVRGNTHL